ncbi:MAG: prolyl oligopeptidase family serine peptidase [Litorimonas sp.]
MRQFKSTRAIFAVSLLSVTACTKTDSASIDVLNELTFETPVYSQADRESPVAAYVKANGASRAQIAPDSSFIALASSKSGEMQLYVGEPDGAKLQQVTDGAGISFFDILPSGDVLYGADNNGDERENYFLYDSVSGVSKIILPATEKGYRRYGGVSGDGTTVAFASTERNGSDFDIYVMDVASGATKQIFEGEYGNFVHAVNQDASKLIISETVGEDADKLFVLDAVSGKRRALSDPTPRANHTEGGVFFIDEDTIRLATNRDREFAALVDMSLQSGEMKTLWQTEADIDEVDVCGETTLFQVNRDGFSELRLYDGDTNAVVWGPSDGVYTLNCNAQTALVRVSGPDRPGDVFRLALNNMAFSPVYSSEFGKLDPSSLIAPTSLRMPASDGVELQGLLYLPATSSTDKPPVVFMVHGGPTAQARPSYNPTAQYLLSRGIAVFQTNVRGSTGFGRTYTTLDDRRKRLDSIRDLVDMLGSNELESLVDTTRAAVMGGSYGGYAVNAVLSEYPDAFIAGVSLYGVADWVTALEVASPALKAADLIEYGNIEDPEWLDFYTEQSPIRNADKIKVPVLFSHGAMDPRIDIAETETMVRALRANGIDAPFIRIPDEGHGWRKLDNQLYYQRRQAEFLEEVFSIE